MRTSLLSWSNFSRVYRIWWIRCAPKAFITRASYQALLPNSRFPMTSQSKKEIWMVLFWRVVRLSLSESWDSPGQAPPDPLVKIIPNDSKWLNMAQNCSKLLIITQNCSKLHQIARNASKWLRIAQHGSKWLQRAPEGSGALRMAPNRSKLLQIEK